MSSTITADSKIASLVSEKHSRSRVFEKYRIDYCCGGKIPLAEACAKKGLDVNQVLDELLKHDEASAAEDNTGRNWSEAALSELIDNIVDEHHHYLRRELPNLLQKAERVAAVHGNVHPETVQVLDIFRGMKDELEEHMDKEEGVLFPWIRGLEAGEGKPPFPGMKMEQPIACMEHDHDKTGKALEDIRRLTSDYTCPPEACNTYRVLYSRLEELEQDTHTHVHKENHILFPRALAMSK